MRRYGTPSCLIAAALSVVLAPIQHQLKAALDPAPEPVAATQPATSQPADIRLNFRDSPLDVVLKHLSEVAGFQVIEDVAVDARVTVVSADPVTPDQAVLMLDTILKANGFAAIHTGRILHITSRDKAKKSNVPVYFGSDPNQILSTDQIITQVLPIKSIDAVKLLQDLRPLIGSDADAAANGGSNAIVITDNASNIHRVAEIISVLDRRESSASTYKVIQLKNASATSAAKLVLAIFHPDDPAQRGPQPPQPQQPREERAVLGNGVDQALHGGKVTAAADDRTNTVVVAGPQATVTLIEEMLTKLDANPATVVTIKSFHLKTADAGEVAGLLTAIFGGENAGNQIHGVGGDGPLRTRIGAVAEYRTNTVIITGPASAMDVVQTLITELDSNPTGEGQVKSFHLKYADVAAVGTAIESALDQVGSRRRRGPGALERISVTPDTRTNTLIVSGPVDAIRQAEKLVNDLDVNPTEGSATRFFHLQMADAGTAAKLISGFFDPGSSKRGGAPNEHVGVNAQADDRSNTVVVNAPPDAMKTVETIIKEIEQQPWLSYDIHTYHLQYADADSTSKLITSIFSPDQSATAPKNQPLRTVVLASADTRTNSVVVTAPQESLKVIDSLVKLLDSNPGVGSDMKVFQLQYADAESAARLIENMFPQPGQLAGSGSGRGPALSGPGTQILLHMPLVITSADDRTNTLVVTAPADVLKVVETLVRQLDSNPASKQTFFIYRLRNGQSSDMAFVMNQLFGGSTTGNQRSPGATGSGLGQRQQSNASSFGNGRGGGGGANRGLGGGGGGRGLGSGVGATGGTSSATGSGASPLGGGLSPGAAQMANALAGQVLVVADPNTNSLLVTTASRFEAQVRQIIAELDRSVPQVLIKVLVAEVTHDNNVDFGTDFSVLNTRPNGNGQSAGQTFGTPGTGLVVNFLENNLNAQLHALAQQNKLDVLSRPYILASDNQPASILVGQQVPIVNSNYTTALGQTVSNYNYESVGIILNVTPHINPDGLVTLDVAPEISQLTAQTVSVGPGVNAPVIADRSAQSRVGIRDGNTIVIGGLMQDQKTLTVNKIPLIGDIPFFGRLFSRTQVDKTKTELLIFLTPHVAAQPELLGGMSQDEVNGTKLTPNAVAPGMMQEHLQGMQRGNRSATQPTTQPLPSVLEFKQGVDTANQTTIQTIPLPIR